MRDDLIGRAGVLGALRTRLSQAMVRPILVLLGEAGTGVSTLLAAVARTVGPVRPATVREVPALRPDALPPGVLVIVDDAHRLDPAGRRALEGLAGNGRRVLAGAHLDLGPLAGAETIRIGDLDLAAADRLLRRSAGDLGPLDRRLIAAHAHGNPLALLELPIAWRAAGPASAERVWSPPVTARHAASLIAGPALLPPDTRAGLDVLAAAGETTMASVVAAAARLGFDAGPALLGPAEVGGVVVVRGQSVMFRDPLVAAAWWQRLPFAGRAAVHEALAATLGGEARWWHAAQAASGPDEELAARLADPRLSEEPGDSGPGDSGPGDSRPGDSGPGDSGPGDSRPGDDMVAVLRRSVTAAQLTSDPRRRAGLLTRAAAAATQLGHRDLAGHLRPVGSDSGEMPGRPASAVLGEAAFEAGDPVRAAGHLAAAATSLATLGRFADLAAATARWADAALATGDWSRAGWAATEAMRLGAETGRPRWTAFGCAVDAVRSAARGDLRRSSAQVAAAETTLAGRPDDAVRARLAIARALALLVRQDPGTAYEILRGSPAEPAVLGHLAEAAVAAGRTAEARELMAGTGADSPALIANLALADAVLSGEEPAFRKALAGALDDWPWLRARTQLAFARQLRAEGRGGDARAQLHLAGATFAALGAGPWQRWTTAELAVSGPEDRPRRPIGLTGQELAVARLAADGLTNREIGERLFLSPRTVASHLYRIFPKLRVTSRRALRERLAEVEAP